MIFTAVILSTINLLITLLVLRRIGNITLEIEKIEAETNQDDHDIHSILNNRLLDLQNKRYSVPQRRGKT